MEIQVAYCGFFDFRGEIWLLMLLICLVGQCRTPQLWRVFLRNRMYNIKFWINMVLEMNFCPK